MEGRVGTCRVLITERSGGCAATKFISTALEIIKAPGARGLRAGRICAGRLRTCMAHSRGLRGRGHCALVQRD